VQLFASFLRQTDRNFLKETIMILSTTPQIEGRPVREYKGVVTGETIIGANFVKDFFAGIDIDYKILPWLKASCGYTFIYDHNRRISHYKENDRDVLKGLAEVGDPKNRRI
jgi:hypothetical protein